MASIRIHATKTDDEDVADPKGWMIANTHHNSAQRHDSTGKLAYPWRAENSEELLVRTKSIRYTLRKKNTTAKITPEHSRTSRDDMRRAP